jgi:hypothetical protein
MSHHPRKLNLRKLEVHFYFIYLIDENALPYVKVLGDFAILDDLVEEYQNVMLELDAGVHQQLIEYFVISTGFATRKILEHLTQLKESVWGAYLIFKLCRVDGWCCVAKYEIKFSNTDVHLVDNGRWIMNRMAGPFEHVAKVMQDGILNLMLLKNHFPIFVV